MDPVPLQSWRVIPGAILQCASFSWLSQLHVPTDVCRGSCVPSRALASRVHEAKGVETEVDEMRVIYETVNFIPEKLNGRVVLQRSSTATS